MSNTKHTPGPWTGQHIIRAPSKTKFPSDGEGICKMYVGTSAALCLEQAANARLIAAAPDLLEALETILYRIEEANLKNKPIGEEWIKYLKFHVNKAKGGAK